MKMNVFLTEEEVVTILSNYIQEQLDVKLCCASATFDKYSSQGFAQLDFEPYPEPKPQ